MTVFMSTHRKVIAYIHIAHQNKPFAIWEIRLGTAVSTSSVTRTLAKLVDLRLVRHLNKPGFKDRNYETTKLWHDTGDVMKVIEVYELAKVLNL